MLVCSVLMLAAGFCANPSATSKAGITINRNTLFMESSEDFLALRRSEISLGI